MVDRLVGFHARYAPWISLALGIVARLLSKQGVDFAPKAVACVALAWLIPLAVARWLRAPPESARESRVHRFVRTASPTVTVLLHKNVLFFVVPIWFGSATVRSVNVLMPIAFAGMALFTCFSKHYREAVLEKPRVRVLWTAIVLFAVLVPATAVVAFTSPRTSIVVAALVSSALAWTTLAPKERLFSLRGLRSAAQVSLPVTVLLAFLAPLFPPVPMVCHDCGVGAAVVKRELVGRANEFARGTARLYSWFEVTLPRRNRQQVAFQWFHEGVPVGGRLLATVEGGRKEGYRTHCAYVAPAIGSWRVDLLTAQSGQLIGRTYFGVGTE